MSLFYFYFFLDFNNLVFLTYSLTYKIQAAA